MRTIRQFAGQAAKQYERYTQSQYFEEYVSLEGRLSEKATSTGYLELADLADIADWGGNQRGVKQRMVRSNTDDEVRQATAESIQNLNNPEGAIRAVLGIRQWGLTYGSKVLRFVDPENYVALDQKLRAGISKTLLPTIYDGNFASMVHGYLRFLDICAEIQRQLSVPGPREGDKWFLADIEMALFQFVWDGGVLIPSGPISTSERRIVAGSLQPSQDQFRLSGAPPKGTSKKERYQEFFQRVLVALNYRQPVREWRIVKNAVGWNWAALHRVRHNVWYGAGFTNDGRVRVDLHLEHTTRVLSQQLFDKLLGRRRDIEGELGFGLEWASPSELGTEAGRLAVYESGNIDEDVPRLAWLQEWMVDRIIKMRTVLASYLDDFLE